MFYARHSWASFVICLSVSPFAYAQGSVGYPGVYDTNQVLHLNMTMDPNDFTTIVNDPNFNIEVPTQFWADGDAPILVGVRRKSGDSLNGKVSYKVDVNEYVNGQKWNLVNKLSLENGDDQDVVTEGLAWYMHRAASGNLPNYTPGLAAWTTLTINGQSQGIYLNVEQPDKQFLRNRSLWDKDTTWLFKHGGGGSEKTAGPTEVSPTMAVLDFSPFVVEGADVPVGEALQILLNQYIDMKGMLTLGAVEAFSSNPDGLFSKSKNFFFVDFAPGTMPANTNGKRTHFPWDLDASIKTTESSIYSGKQGNQLILTEFQEVILGDPVFRAQYNNIMLSLLAGPLSVGSLTAFLDDMQPILTAPLEADANNQLEGESASDHFDSLRQFVSDRHANVYQQVIDDLGASDFNGDGIVDGEDFLLWQRDPSVGSLADWEANYGATFTPLSASSAAVPEPTTWIGLLIGMLTMLFRRNVVVS